MSSDWLTYKEAGAALGVSAEAARQRAIRGNWPRRLNNEGVALVRVPEGVTSRPRPKNERPNEDPAPRVVEQADERLIEALQAHIETLKADLALARDQAAQAIEAHQRLAVKLAKLKARRKKR
jgi:hypothetical protein